MLQGKLDKLTEDGTRGYHRDNAMCGNAFQSPKSNRSPKTVDWFDNMSNETLQRDEVERIYASTSFICNYLT